MPNGARQPRCGAQRSNVGCTRWLGCTSYCLNSQLSSYCSTVGVGILYFSSLNPIRKRRIGVSLPFGVVASHKRCSARTYFATTALGTMKYLRIFVSKPIVTKQYQSSVLEMDSFFSFIIQSLK